jgi:U3 small nucleolar RNA-associated protein 12
LIVGTKEGAVHLYDLSSSSLIESVDAHEGAVWGLQVRPDKTGFATGSADKEVKFWDFCLVGTEGGKRLSISHTRTLKMSDDVLAVCHSPDGRLIAVSLLDATVKVFFTDSLKFSLSLYGHKLPVLSMDIASDSTIIATASADKSVKLWGLDFGDCHRSILAHTDSVMGVKFSWGTHYFFTVSKDRNVKYWDADAGSVITTLEAGHHGEVWGLAVAKYGAFVVTGSHDRSLRVWNKTDEQLFLEEEREREMDDMFDRVSGREGRDEGGVGSGALDGAGDLIQQEEGEEDAGGEVGLAGAKTKDTLKAGEKLLEALEVWAEERAALDAYKIQVGRGDKGVVAHKTSPFIVALGDPDMTPELYVLHVLERVRASSLEQALVVLPFVMIENLLTCIASWSEQV